MNYGTDQGLIDYLALTGRALPADAVPAVVRHFGTQYVDQWEFDYKGAALSVDNSFPRDLWDPTPARVEHAAYEAAFAYASGVEIFGGGGTAGGQVVEERVDVISVKYAAPKEGSGDGYWENNRFVLPLAYSLLIPFFRRTKGYGGAAFVVGGGVGLCGC